MGIEQHVKSIVGATPVKRLDPATDCTLSQIDVSLRRINAVAGPLVADRQAIDNIPLRLGIAPNHQRLPTDSLFEAWLSRMRGRGCAASNHRLSIAVERRIEEQGIIQRREAVQSAYRKQNRGRHPAQ